MSNAFIQDVSDDYRQLDMPKVVDVGTSILILAAAVHDLAHAVRAEKTVHIPYMDLLAECNGSLVADALHAIAENMPSN